MSEPAPVTRLSVGSRVWWEGDFWDVRSLGDGRAQLDLRGRAMTVAINDLARAALESEPAEPSAIGGDALSGTAALTSLAPAERERIERLAEQIARLLDDTGPLAPRLVRAAKELGLSHRTLERRVAAYRRSGVAGLIDSRATKTRTVRVDPRWDETCVRVLRSYTNASTPTRSAVLARVAREVEEEYGVDVVPLPATATAYRRLNDLARGRQTFGGASGRRSIAGRPETPYGRLRADRPGQYVVLDTNDLDVFAMEPATLRWVKTQLTVAIDLFSRCVLGLALTPVSTKSADVANVLYQCVRPGEAAEPSQAVPYHGVPEAVLIGTEVPDERLLRRAAGLPVAFPESIVIDRGRQYMSAHVIGACSRLGISVQLANPHKPTDKPVIERFFRSLREGLLQHLPAYKGPDVYSRGKDVEDHAFLWVSELEQIIREWVTTIYHHRPHSGLTVPDLPRACFSPVEAYNIGLARAGGLTLPTSADLAYEFLEVQWRTIQHYGIDVNGLRYDGIALNPYRSRSSPYSGRHKGKWPFHVDVHDVRRVHFKDPADNTWHALVWEHAAGLDAPFSRDAAQYTKRLALREDRHVDPDSALTNLLDQWSRGSLTDRRERNLAIRLSAERADGIHPGDDAATAKIAQLPTVANLDERRTQRGSIRPADELDVFEEFPPDEFGYEVIDE